MQADAENSTPQRICIETLQEKYCVDDERSAIDVQRRVARALAGVEKSPDQWETIFLDAQMRGVVMGGRINSSAGTARQSTWINCFVQPIADAISHSDAQGRPGIYVAFGSNRAGQQSIPAETGFLCTSEKTGLQPNPSDANEAPSPRQMPARRSVSMGLLSPWDCLR